ncbi:MAG TPA: hypothetical protein DD435_14240 [Cyanobacteria bacterium UBA8530]|nr:hypothetical protein [Cyanobacteria bacterium UBA8530]
MKFRILPMVLVLILLAAPSHGATFSDLSDPIEQASATVLGRYQVMPSLSPTEFGGSNPITRFDLAEILDNLLDPRDIPFQVISFTDVPPGHRDAKSVNKVVCFDILRANGGLFQGSSRVQRISLVESLDRLLTYRSILPPPRRKSAFFPDVKKNTPVGLLLDRGANFWQFLDNPDFIRFRPNELVSRGEAVVMVARVAGLIDPMIAADLKKEVPVVSESPLSVATPAPTKEPALIVETPKPVPSPLNAVQPSAAPSEGPPSWLLSSPSPSVEATPSPEASNAPPSPPPLPVLHWNNGFTLDPSLLFISDSLSSSSQNGSGMLSTLHLNGNWGFGSIAGFLDLNTTILPGSLNTKATSMSNPTSFIDFMLHLSGLYRLPWRGVDWESAGGLGAVLHLTMAETSGISAGIGPAGMVVYRPLPALSLTGALQIHPLLFAGNGLALGLNPSFEADYKVIPLFSGQLSLHGGINEQLDIGFGGGSSSLTAIYAGLGLTF